MFARDYVAGYLDMTEWANPNIVTNYTVGFFVMFGLLGATIGTAVEIWSRKRKWTREKRLMWQMICSLGGSLIFAYILSAVGMMEGFRY